ncbi:MAG: alpha/beta hydrolase [Pseudomonadota bacterium]
MNTLRIHTDGLLKGERLELEVVGVGMINYYRTGPEGRDTTADVGSVPEAPPLLLIHSINATASAHEVEPLFEHFRHARKTYALDLPGFGFSEKNDRLYDQALMVSAIEAMIERVLKETGARSIDAIAVSLSCEFLAKLAARRPELRSLGFISPTGFSGNSPSKGRPDTHNGKPLLLKALKTASLGRKLFGLLTSRISIRYFLKKTWGSDDIDEMMFRRALWLGKQPNAHLAPLHFIAGFLFSANILPVYQSLSQPIWLVHGCKGDFSDYSKLALLEHSENWSIHALDTGALPYFEQPETVVHSFEVFSERLDV